MDIAGPVPWGQALEVNDLDEAEFVILLLQDGNVQLERRAMVLLQPVRFWQGAVHLARKKHLLDLPPRHWPGNVHDNLRHTLCHPCCCHLVRREVERAQRPSLASWNVCLVVGYRTSLDSVS